MPLREPLRLRVSLSDGESCVVHVKVAGKKVRRTEAKHTITDCVTYTPADNRKLYMLAGPDSGLLERVKTGRHEYVILQQDSWYALALETNRPVLIVAVEVYYNYQAVRGGEAVWVLNSWTRKSGSLPVPFAPLDILAPPPSARSKRRKTKRASAQEYQRERKSRRQRRGHARRDGVGVVRPVPRLSGVGVSGHARGNGVGAVRSVPRLPDVGVNGHARGDGVSVVRPVPRLPDVGANGHARGDGVDAVRSVLRLPVLGTHSSSPRWRQYEEDDA